MKLQLHLDNRAENGDITACHKYDSIGKHNFYFERYNFQILSSECSTLLPYLEFLPPERSISQTMLLQAICCSNFVHIPPRLS